ncbi:MAG: type IV toxin-antitoxin system AbiEi family antitoxin [Gemmatimonadetes bacterium]|nr:type IV toxin-antitoxin system AbiEi family antitoxin [Gemmatimonadota bacterium]
MASAARYIRDLQARGRYHFTTDEAAQALGGSVAATCAALRRLKEKGLVADPYRSFHVIVPPEYAGLRCLPADQFVPDLMQHLREPYYVALLSAAAYHGAAHQRPQVFQVMVSRARRALRCGQVSVDFIARQDMAGTPVVQRNTPRGVLRISSPEATALELVAYPDHGGGLSNVATVLVELIESMDAHALEAEASRVPTAWVQRLGYLLSLVEAEEYAVALEPVLGDRARFFVALAPSVSMAGAVRDVRWKVAVNVEVEPDL